VVFLLLSCVRTSETLAKIGSETFSDSIFYHLLNVIVDWSNPLHQRAGWIAVTVVWRVFLNSPYARGVIAPFVRKLIAEYESGHVQEANLLVRPCTDTKWYQKLLQYPVCFMRSSITFYTSYTGYKRKAFTKNTYKNYFWE